MITKTNYEEAKKIVDAYEKRLEYLRGNCFTFNINHKVSVKLTEEGFMHWYNDFASLPPTLRPTLESLKEKQDEDGFVEFQLWKLMQIFGGAVKIGGNLFFDTNLRFFKEDFLAYKTI